MHDLVVQCSLPVASQSRELQSREYQSRLHTTGVVLSMPAPGRAERTNLCDEPKMHLFVLVPVPGTVCANDGGESARARGHTVTLYSTQVLLLVLADISWGRVIRGSGKSHKFKFSCKKRKS